MCWGSTRTPHSANSRSIAGRFVSGQLVCSFASRPGPLWLRRRMNVGQRICAVSGLGKMAEHRWPIFSTATRASCWLGTCLALAARPRPPTRWSRPSSPDSEHWRSCLIRSCCGPTMGWCSPTAITLVWSGATRCVRSSPPHCPQQNGMVERVILTLKEQCVRGHRFESLQNTIQFIGDWIGFYNHQRPHQALRMKTPAEVYTLAASPVQELLGQYSSKIEVGPVSRAVSNVTRHRPESYALSATGLLANHPPSTANRLTKATSSTTFSAGTGFGVDLPTETVTVVSLHTAALGAAKQTS